MAPWINAHCTKSFLNAASGDGARALISYLARDLNSPNSTAAPPPPPNDPVWGLNDGGTWKSSNKFPVYVIPAGVGASIMQALAWYSGNMTEVPNGSILVRTYDSRNYVRLYGTVDTGSTSSLSSLWAFLLIVLAMLLTIIGLTSLLMHWIQRRRRHYLRRLIATGQVDLEALGITRLRVPAEFLDKIPLFVYIASDSSHHQSRSPTPTTMPEANPRQPEEDREPVTEHAAAHAPVPNPADIDSTVVPLRHGLQHRILPAAQPTCAICLDDFVSSETIVRELPCGHLYHPECIDPVLKEYSSLCPMCKGKVLPVGCCPTEITNSMVRRERHIRRMREPLEGDRHDHRTLMVGRNMASFHRQFGRWHVAPARRLSSAPAATTVPSPPAVDSSSTGPRPPMLRPPGASRGEWARRRAAMLLGNMGSEDDREDDGESRLPRCTSILSTV